MTAPARFTQADLTRAIKGVEAAGARAAAIEIDRTGKIVILFDSDGAPRGGANEWDEVLPS